MGIDEKKRNEIEWYDNPDVVTTFIIGLIALIVILSQSFAINNNLSPASILGSILNHNIVYLLVCVYFIALKTKIGKKYFDFLNVFLILLHGLTAISSLLTIFQSFGLGSLLGLAIDLLVLIYLIHTFLRSTRIWKSMNLNKSPFNEISNSGYFYSILVIAITLLAVNLISTTSFDGSILTLMDTGYTILFIRYVFLYGEFLNKKKISVKNDGNFDEYRKMIKVGVNNFVEKNELDEKYESMKEKISDFTDDVKEKTVDIKEDIQEKLEDIKLDEKIEDVKEKVADAVTDIRGKTEEKFEKVNFKNSLDENKRGREFTSRKRYNSKEIKNDSKKENK